MVRYNRQQRAFLRRFAGRGRRGIFRGRRRTGLRVQAYNRRYIRGRRMISYLRRTPSAQNTYTRLPNHLRSQIKSFL